MMQFTFEIIAFALLVIVLNVLDSVTTHLAFKQYPDKELKGEGNPFMRRMMLKSSLLAGIVKHAGVLALVLWWVYVYGVKPLRLASIMFGLVVLNNAFIVVSRAITKRKVDSPSKRLLGFLHIPDKYAYMVVVVVLAILSVVVYSLVWDWS